MSSTRICIFVKLSLLVLVFDCQKSGGCKIPREFHGDWYSFDYGQNVYTMVNESSWKRRNSALHLECYQMYNHSDPDYQQEGNNFTMLMREVMEYGNRNTECVYCLDVLWRTPNILQYRKGNCVRNNTGVPLSIDTLCRSVNPRYGLPTTVETITLFRRTPRSVDCKTTIEGVYQFSYEEAHGGGGICSNSDNKLIACTERGSPYIDNEVFRMNFGQCDGVNTFRDKDMFRYQCLGSWYAVRYGVGYTYAAVADTVEQDDRKKYKCMMTLKNQRNPNNKIRWVMSRSPTCSTLGSIYNAPVRLVFKKRFPSSHYATPNCTLPDDVIRGEKTVLSSGAKVNINETNINVVETLNGVESQNTQYSCQQKLDTRYVMTKVVKGKCKVQFVCIEMLPQNNETIKFRFGWSIGVPRKILDMNIFFRNVCNWNALKFNWDGTEKIYDLLI